MIYPGWGHSPVVFYYCSFYGSGKWKYDAGLHISSELSSSNSTVSLNIKWEWPNKICKSHAKALPAKRSFFDSMFYECYARCTYKGKVKKKVITGGGVNRNTCVRSRFMMGC